MRVRLVLQHTGSLRRHRRRRSPACRWRDGFIQLLIRGCAHALKATDVPVETRILWFSHMAHWGGIGSCSQGGGVLGAGAEAARILCQEHGHHWWV